MDLWQNAGVLLLQPFQFSCSWRPDVEVRVVLIIMRTSVPLFDMPPENLIREAPVASHNILANSGVR